jgi:hypothetical protein
MRLVNVPTKNERLIGRYDEANEEFVLVNATTEGVVCTISVSNVKSTQAADIAQFGEVMRNVGYQQALAELRIFLGVQ